MATSALAPTTPTTSSAVTEHKAQPPSAMTETPVRQPKQRPLQPCAAPWGSGAKAPATSSPTSELVSQTARPASSESADPSHFAQRAAAAAAAAVSAARTSGNEQS